MPTISQAEINRLAYKQGVRPEDISSQLQSKGYTAPATTQEAGVTLPGVQTAPTQTPTIPATPAPTTQPVGSVSSILGDMGAGDNFYNQYYQDQLNAYNAPIDETAIRKQKESEFQAQIDAIKAVYADKLRQEKQTSQGRLGSGRALQARSGLIGSDFGAAQTENISQLNREQEQSIENERLALVSQVLSQAQSNAAQEIAAKRAAKEAGGKAYLDYLAGASTRKQEKTNKAAKLLLSLGKSPQDISDEELKQAGISRQDLTMEYTAGKSAQEATSAAAKLAGKKTQAEIDKLSAETDLTKLKQGEYYEVGGKIYSRKDNSFIGNAQSVQAAASGVTGGVGFSTNAPAGGFRTDRHNNPTAMTTDVARSLGLVEGVDYTKGDPFPNNPNLFTARLNGDPIQTTIKALDLAAQDPNKSAFRTQAGQPRWTYIDMTDEQWNSMTPEQKTATITKMYQNEGGTGALVGGGGGLSDLAQSVQKGIITIAQIPAAQRSAIAAELAQAGTQSPKTRELQNSLDLVDTLLSDENALKSISGWWGGRLPGSGIFSNQLAANQFDQLKGILSLGEREKLKGTGAISDYESKLLANSASALGRNLSEEDFKAELEKIRDILSGKYKYYTDGAASLVKSSTSTTPPTPTGGVVNGAI